MAFRNPKQLRAPRAIVVCAVAGIATACSGDATTEYPNVVGTHSLALALPVYAEVTPNATPLSETSVQLTWTAPTGTIDHYDVFLSTSQGTDPDLSAKPYLANISKTATQATLKTLAPGSLRRAIVAATLTGDAGAGSVAQSALVWTPFGAVNEDSVNTVTPLAGLSTDLYSEATYISSKFSMLFGHAYAPELSFVFAGPPPSPTARPVYNFASTVVKMGNGFSYPGVTDVNQIWSDGKRLLLSNDNQNRLLVYNHLPTSADKATPDLLLGQTTWTGTAIDNGAGAPNAQGLHQSAGACYNGKTLYVRDNANNRILGYSSWPTQMGQAADFVLGQPDFTSNTANNGGVSKSSVSFGIDGAAGVDCSRGLLVVTDSGNHRVVIWKKAPTKAGVPADIVLGQSNGTTGGKAGAGGIAAGGLLSPANAVVMSNSAGQPAIFVADYEANRVVGWNTIPSSDGAPFDTVIGQPDRNTTTPNTGGKSLSSLNGPLSLSVDDQNQLWVSDFTNCRWLTYTAGSATAFQVFGQRDGTSLEFEAGSFSPTRFGWTHYGKGQFSLDPVSGLFSPFPGRFWNQAPSNGNTPLSGVQGQIDENRDAPVKTSASTVAGGGGVVQVGTRVYYSDHARILSKVGTFSGDNANADVVLGNQDFNGNVVGPTTLDYAINPTYLASDGTNLLAVDGARIVGWKTAPTSSNQPISFAIGQPSMLENTPNNGGVSGSTLGAGRNTLTVSGGKLVVADPANNRVLIWNTMPVTTGVPADVVLGQSSFSTAETGTRAWEMNSPSSVAVLDGKLVVSDTGNGRLLVFGQIPRSGVGADYIWSPSTNRFSMPSWFNGDELAPRDIGAYQGRLYVGQTGRILVVPDFFPVVSPNGGQTPDITPLQVVTIAPPAARIVANVNQDGTGSGRASAQPSSPTPFTLPQQFEIGGEIGNNTATLTYTNTSGTAVSCTFQGQSSTSTPDSVADLEAGRILQLMSCSDGLPLTSQRSGTNFNWNINPLPGWPVNIDLPLDDRSCAQTFELLTGQKTRQLHDSFSWSKAKTVQETNSDGTPTLFYAWVYIRNNQDLLNLHKMFVHILSRPLFLQELNQFAGKCGTFRNPGDGIGMMAPVLMPGTVYNTLVNVHTQQNISGNRDIFDSVILRNNEVPSGVRNANGSVNLKVLAQSGFGYLDYEPQPLPNQGDITLNGAAVAAVTDATAWVLQATQTVGRVITSAIGSIDRLFAGSVNFDITIRALNQDGDFNKLTSMTRGWGTGAGGELGTAGMRVTLLQALADGLIPETYSSISDGAGHVSIQPAQHQSGFTRGSGICITLENDSARLASWVLPDQICDFRGLQIPPNKSSIDAYPKDDFVIQSFDYDQNFKLMISDPGLATLYEMDDVYRYDHDVIGKDLSTAHVLTGLWADTLTGTFTGHLPFTMCLHLRDTNGGGVFGALIKGVVDSLTWPKYLDQDAKANLTAVFTGSIGNNDILMPYDPIYTQREVASHEYGHYTLCNYMNEQDNQAIDLLVQSSFAPNGKHLNYGTRYVNEAFADFISGQVTGIANYHWVQDQPSPEPTKVCAIPSSGPQQACYDHNFNAVATADDGLESIARISSLIHDAFDGHGPSNRQGNVPNDADAWKMTSDGTYAYSTDSWGNFDGDKETVALSGPSIRTFLHALANDANTKDPGLISSSQTGYFDDYSVDLALNDTMNGEGVSWCGKCPVLELHSPSAPVPAGETVDDLSIRDLLLACNGGDSTINSVLGQSPVDPTNLRIDVKTCTECPDNQTSDENGVCQPCIGTIIGNTCQQCNPDAFIEASGTPLSGDASTISFETTDAGPLQNCPGWFWLQIDDPAALYPRGPVSMSVVLSVDTPTTPQLCESQFSFTVATPEGGLFVPGAPISATGDYTPPGHGFTPECPITPVLEFDGPGSLPQVGGAPATSIRIGVRSRSDLHLTWQAAPPPVVTQ